MLLIGYFLTNDCHVSDAFAWAGLYLRQAYAMKLHREPSIVVEEASVMEKQQRRKVWQAVFHFDTASTVLLKLPPTATHSDVDVDALTLEDELRVVNETDCDQWHSRVENLMSTAAISPPQGTERPHPPPPQPHHIPEPDSNVKDLAYIKSIWRIGQMVQENISSPNSLSLTLVDDAAHKQSLIESFWKLHKTFPAHLTELDMTVLQQQALVEPRAVVQNIFLNNYFYHSLMLVEVSENVASGVECNVQETLKAAHEVLWTHFKLWQLFPGEAHVWWEPAYRAFEAALLTTRILSMPDILEHVSTEQINVARTDILQTLEAIDRCSELRSCDMQRTRWTVLQEHYEKIMI